MSQGTIARPEQGQAEVAFLRLLPEFEALSIDELQTVNVDAAASSQLVLGSLERLNSLRAELQRLPHFSVEQFDKLEPLAWSLAHAQTLYMSASRSGCPAGLVAEGERLRSRLVSELRVLANRGLLDGSRLRNITLRRGYLQLSNDLGILSRVLTDCWPEIEGRCAVPRDDVQRAAYLREHFVRALSRREQRPENMALAAELRQRVFTLLYRAYDATRRGVVYVRWEQRDWDAYAPSLFVGHGGSRRVKPTEPSEAPLATSPEPSPALPAAESFAPSDNQI